MKGFRLVLIALAAVTTFGSCATTKATAPASSKAATGFINETLIVGTEKLAYNVYVPREYDPAKKWPLVIFLHGSGERGGDGLLQTDVGIGHAIRMHPDRFPCVVVMPQCPAGSGWNDRHDIIDAALAQGLADFKIDRRRVYLTGLSMGGYGTWSYGAAHPDTFAALIAICGGGKTSDAPALAKMPIRVFHGSDDSVVKPAASRAMVEAVKQAGGDIEYTEYPGVNHNSWDKTYGDAAVIEWLLAQRKR